VRVIGHRGARAIEPENTLRSFRRAQQVGADEVELDLRVTADGALVVLHDATVDRTTDGHGPVAALTLAQVRALDAGAGERVPTFAEVLDAVTVPVQAEVKVPEVVPLLAALAADLAGRVVVSSFDPAIVAALPGFDRALIRPDAPPDAVAMARAVGAGLLCLGLADLGAALRTDCRAAGIAIDAWPVNDPAALRRAVELDVEAITTDNPHLIGDWL